MLVYKGVSALSDFRRQKLLQRLQTVNRAVTSIEAEYVHVVDTKNELSPQELTALEKLVSYGTPFTGSRDGTTYFVIPRPGTISPWSSKATDIVHNATVHSVNRIERGVAYYIVSGDVDTEAISTMLHDRMNESVLPAIESAEKLFQTEEPKKLSHIPILDKGKVALQNANKSLGLALADDEIEYLYKSYTGLQRDPTDVELMMFAQVNSEHCRHKIFNADWIIDSVDQSKSLFKMIKNTYEKGGQDVLSAYSDNAAVLKGPQAGRFFAQEDGTYTYHTEPIHSVIKVETHNHPTAISPIPGAATGIGGEIRDEAATGQGAKSKMGLSGFSVSNLSIPSAIRAWESKQYGKPDRIASPLEIMLDAPIGGAGFANEFGRPNLAGYFRTFEHQSGEDMWGYHKPIMIAGGLGNIRPMHVLKQRLPVGSLIVHLGGPGMLIGLGGGAASSMQTGTSDAELDFASVQRGNGEIERRAQEVIDRCWSLGEKNPIITIHDVGAGGLSNALPEIVHDSSRGAAIELRDIPSAEPNLSPLEIWCNESQERYVLGIAEEDLEMFKGICERERCPFSVVGTVTEKEELIVTDRLFNEKSIDIPLDVLFGKPPKMTRTFNRKEAKHDTLDISAMAIEDAVERVLKLPSVGSKKFLITIGDRTVGGLVVRDQMVGRWQVPVSDVAVTAVSFDSNSGEALSMGERTPVAVINPAAAARMAIAETITNIVSADIQSLSDVKLSANWMAAVGYEHEDQHLYDSVLAVGEEFCPALGLTIPVGKDSLSMRTAWHDGKNAKSVASPVSLIVTGFSPVKDVAKTLTPELDMTKETELFLLDLSSGHARLGGSALAQVYNQLGDESPDADPESMKTFFENLKTVKQSGKIAAYHDRSDGGLLTTLLEMAFASRCGLAIDISKLHGSTLEKLFNEELGAVIQVESSYVPELNKLFGERAIPLGAPTIEQTIIFTDDSTEVYRNTREQLEMWWSDTSYQIQKLRDNPKTTDQELRNINDNSGAGLSADVRFTPAHAAYTTRPKVAIFREQGVNGHIEMAAAFDKAGFSAIDVHLNDLLDGKKFLEDFTGLVACGGFSYGDVLGAGEGWAKSILFHDNLRTLFSAFFARSDTFTLGVCNGCQMLSALKELIPGADSWPTFLKNTSEQFEARLVLTKINKTPSIFFRNMEGSHFPVPVAHGEGRAAFGSSEDLRAATDQDLIVAQYVNENGSIADTYPQNPNGSEHGITALTTIDGRATILMPHPERAFLSRQLSWHPKDWPEDSPWMQMFHNARAWVGE